MNPAGTPADQETVATATIADGEKNTQGDTMVIASATAASNATACLLVGQNSHGEWIVRDRPGRRGGMFVSLADAQRFVRLESIGRPVDVVMVPGCLDLDGAYVH